MSDTARRWRVLAAGATLGIAGVFALAGQTASADPLIPVPPAPAIPAPAMPATPAAPAALLPQTAPIAAPAVAVPVAPAITPATSGTLEEYFKSKGVTMQPQVSHDFKALSIVLPMPAGWSTVPDPNVPDAFAVIADRTSTDLYTPNAQVVVYKLVGDFDPNEAISHGLVDSLQQTGWRSTDMSLAPFGGFPAAFIEGSYQADSQMLNTSRRHVIATVGADHYLVSLSVNSSAANQGISAAADAADAIVAGFKVAAPGPPAPVTPPAVPAPAPAAAPAAAGLPQFLGLPS